MTSSRPDVELRLAIAEGLVARPDAEALAAEAARDGQGLLERLRAEGHLSEESLASLRARLAADTRDHRALAPTVELRRDPARADAASHDAEPDGFPVPWDRYQPIRLLGQGGMGRVFLARDLRLHRDVAIKFVRGDDPELTRRILVEARAQARVDDERVCKVFDVGEVAGRAYIAMEHIDGRPLPDLVGELTYEQKALVMRGAALGVHEAHRAGVLHRDLKPSNILVERGADGALRPFVMDFGVARDWTAGDTATGTVLGTPGFMSPEQARGEINQLDRRADVYGLGATLYALLTGRPPIDGDNPLVVLNRVSIDEPIRPRALDRDLPADLDAIVTKCLEKQRGARYDSARALADDLGRFLDGTPVLARASAGLGYRLRKRLRRHWRGVALAGVTLAIVAVALGVAVRERGAAEHRAALARRFTERVERIEAVARYSALAPAHDLTADRAHIQREMDAIGAEIRAAGGAATASGHYALGRGHLALGDDDRAYAELREAWARGFRDPRAAYALALAEGHLYQRALRALERRPPAVREQRRPALEARYQVPARDHLRAAVGADLPSAAYIGALLAYYEGRFDDALRELDSIESAAAWFYEAPLLRGQILHQRALVTSGGSTADELDAQLAASRRAFDAATTVGRSDLSLHLAIADFEYTVFGIELYGRGQIDEPYRRGLAALDVALGLMPDHGDALTMRARFRRGLAEWRGGRGEDARAVLDQAVADAGRAVAIDPSDVDARFELSRCVRQEGELAQRQQRDPGEALGRAIAILDAIPAADRTDQMLTHLGLSHKIWADYLDGVGGDSADHRQRAIDAFRAALALTDSDFRAWINLGLNHYQRALRADLTAASADDDLAQAQAAFARSRALQPHSIVLDQGDGAVHELRARRRAAQGGDPEPDRAAAIGFYQHGLGINPDDARLHASISFVETERAFTALQRGDDPAAALDRAEVAARRAIALTPDAADAHDRLLAVLLVRAQSLALRGADLGPVVDAGTRAVEDALAQTPGHLSALRNAVDLHLLAARTALDRGRDGRPALARARGYLDRARALAPEHPWVQELAASYATEAARLGSRR